MGEAIDRLSDNKKNQFLDGGRWKMSLDTSRGNPDDPKTDLEDQDFSSSYLTRQKTIAEEEANLTRSLTRVTTILNSPDVREMLESALENGKKSKNFKLKDYEPYRHPKEIETKSEILSSGKSLIKTVLTLNENLKSYKNDKVDLLFESYVLIENDYIIMTASCLSIRELCLKNILAFDISNDDCIFNDKLKYDRDFYILAKNINSKYASKVYFSTIFFGEAIIITIRNLIQNNEVKNFPFLSMINISDLEHISEKTNMIITDDSICICADSQLEFLTLRNSLDWFRNIMNGLMKMGDLSSQYLYDYFQQFSDVNYDKEICNEILQSERDRWFDKLNS